MFERAKRSFWKAVAAAASRGVPAIEVADLKRLRDAGEEMTLLDVREPFEVETARIEGAQVIPMREIPDRLGEIDRSKPTVVFCHHGGRSARVAGFLIKNGFKDVVNLEGGIDAWSEQVDPKVPRY